MAKVAKTQVTHQVQLHLFPKDHGSSEMGKLRPETLC